MARNNSSKPSLIGAMIDFLLKNKKWWITPIVVVLLLIGVLIFLGGSSVAPFIYSPNK